ncbi:unnamed protein product [Amoebophrya sp. A25]|nr:unnamed protein product [Amoebophrya sp. A25]|eukprot:GSA25T00008622001.1
MSFKIAKPRMLQSTAPLAAALLLVVQQLQVVVGVKEPIYNMRGSSWMEQEQQPEPPEGLEDLSSDDAKKAYETASMVNGMKKKLDDGSGPTTEGDTSSTNKGAFFDGVNKNGLPLCGANGTKKPPVKISHRRAFFDQWHRGLWTLSYPEGKTEGKDQNGSKKEKTDQTEYVVDKLESDAKSVSAKETMFTSDFAKLAHDSACVKLVGNLKAKHQYVNEKNKTFSFPRCWSNIFFRYLKPGILLGLALMASGLAGFLWCLPKIGPYLTKIAFFGVLLLGIYADYLDRTSFRSVESVTTRYFWKNPGESCDAERGWLVSTPAPDGRCQVEEYKPSTKDRDSGGSCAVLRCRKVGDESDWFLEARIAAVEAYEGAKDLAEGGIDLAKNQLDKYGRAGDAPGDASPDAAPADERGTAAE